MMVEGMIRGIPHVPQSFFKPRNMKISQIVLPLAALTFLAFSCTPQVIEPQNPQAFSSNSGSCTVWTTDYVSDASIFDITAVLAGNTHEAYENGTVELGFVVTENSQNPGEVYLRVGASNWRRLNECRNSGIAGFWDGLSKNDSEDAKLIQAGSDIYLFYGGNNNTYQRFRIDNGEVLKKVNNGSGTLPSGFNGRVFFHDYDRADFPANWLGVKGKKLYTFGSSLGNTPQLIEVRVRGNDINGKIKRVESYWPFNNQRIILSLDGNKTVTVQKERNSGVNFYKK